MMCREMGHSPKPVAGQVDIAESAIADLVRDAVKTCYGVVGIGSTASRRLPARLPGPWRHHPIKISVITGRISIAIPVIVQYGTPITTVARNVIQTVSFQLRQSLGLDVERVDVHVSGLRHEPADGKLEQ
jgi:uncharacterized alkaline shock family protein YloU